MRNFAKANTVELPTKNAITYFNEGRMPIDVQGTVLLPAIPHREYVKDFFKEKGISDDLLCEHFLEMLANFLKGVVSGDEE
jgi:hypothetical protein